MKKRKPLRFPGPSVARFDTPYTYSVELGLGTWAYALETGPGKYGPGWYPFHRTIRYRVPDSENLVAHVGRRVETDKSEPRSVRISPDTAFRSWGNEYVTLLPYGNDARVIAHMNLFVAHGFVRRVDLGIDLRHQGVMLPEQLPSNLKGQAEIKGARILDFLNRARSERRRGEWRPHAVLHLGVRSGQE